MLTLRNNLCGKHEETLFCSDLINYEPNVFFFSVTAAWCYASCQSADTHRKSPPEITRLTNVTVTPMILIQGIFICWKSTFQSRFDRTCKDCFKNALEDVTHGDDCKMTPVWHRVQCPGLNRVPSQPHFPPKIITHLRLRHTSDSLMMIHSQ